MKLIYRNLTTNSKTNIDSLGSYTGKYFLQWLFTIPYKDIPVKIMSPYKALR